MRQGRFHMHQCVDSCIHKCCPPFFWYTHSFSSYWSSYVRVCACVCVCVVFGVCVCAHVALRRNLLDIFVLLNKTPLLQVECV